jgi:hypothetical protein
VTKRFFVYVHRRADTTEIFYIGKGTWTPLKRYIRASTTSHRNVHWQRIVAKACGFTHEIVGEFDDEALALAEEVRRIAEHGRANLGGMLCNITAGGEGQSGASHSVETRSKIAAALRGKPKSAHVKAAVSLAQRGVPSSPEQGRAHSLYMSGVGNPNWGKKNSPETIAKRISTRGQKCSGADHPFYGKKRPQHVIDALRAKNSRPVIDRTTGITYPSVKDAAKAIGKADTTLLRWLSGRRPNPTRLEFA